MYLIINWLSNDRLRFINIIQQNVDLHRVKHTMLLAVYVRV